LWSTEGQTYNNMKCDKLTILERKTANSKSLPLRWKEIHSESNIVSKQPSADVAGNLSAILFKLAFSYIMIKYKIRQ